MIRTLTPVSDIYHPTILPIIQQISFGILNDLYMLELFGENIRFKANGLGASDSTDSDGKPNLSGNYATINITNNFNQKDQLHSNYMAVYDTGLTGPNLETTNRAPLLSYADASLRIVERMKPTTIRTEWSLRFDDRSKAVEAMQVMNSIYSLGYKNVTVDFTYPIPKDVYLPLYKLWKMLRPNLGFMDFLYAASNNRIEKIVNKHDASDATFGVRNIVSGITMLIEMGDGEPEPIGNEKSPNMWDVKFSVSFQIGLVNTLALEYPIAINNTLVPKELLPIRMHKLHTTIGEDHPYTNYDNYAKWYASKVTKLPEPISIPWYDGWMPNKRKFPFDYEVFFKSIVFNDNIGNPDLKTHVNLLTDFGVTFVNAVAANIDKYSGGCLLPNATPLFIGVFHNDVMLEPSSLVLSDDYILSIPMRETDGTYRIILSSKEPIKEQPSKTATPVAPTVMESTWPHSDPATRTIVLPALDANTSPYLPAHETRDEMVDEFAQASLEDPTLGTVRVMNTDIKVKDTQ